MKKCVDCGRPLIAGWPWSQCTPCLFKEDPNKDKGGGDKGKKK